jgi:virginiamycin B lyase
MIRRTAGSISLAMLTCFATGCANSESGVAPPAAVPPVNDARSSSPAHREHVRISEFSDLPEYSYQYHPNAIAAGPAGLVWVVDTIDLDFGEGVVVGVAPSGKAMHTYDYPATSTGADFIDITVGPDGALWLTDDNNLQIVRLTTGGRYRNFPLKDGSDPVDITAGPDGALWFTARKGSTGLIERMTTKGKITSYTLPDLAGDITAGPDGALWFTEGSPTHGIGRITTAGKVTQYTSGITGLPEEIALGPDGALWFTENATGGDKIGRITTSGQVTEYSQGISPSGALYDISAGPDGAMWFVQYGPPEIGRISMSGAITEYSNGFNPQSAPDAIVTGPDNNLWFADWNMDQTGRARVLRGKT